MRPTLKFGVNKIDESRVFNPIALNNFITILVTYLKSKFNQIYNFSLESKSIKLGIKFD